MHLIALVFGCMLWVDAGLVWAQSEHNGAKSWKTVAELSAQERERIDLATDTPRHATFPYLPAEPYPRAGCGAGLFLSQRSRYWHLLAFAQLLGAKSKHTRLAHPLWSRCRGNPLWLPWAGQARGPAPTKPVTTQNGRIFCGLI